MLLTDRASKAAWALKGKLASAQGAAAEAKLSYEFAIGDWASGEVVDPTLLIRLGNVYLGSVRAR